MSFNTILKIMIIMFVATIATGCSKVSVNNGEAVVYTLKPWFFGSGGVDKDADPTGLYWIALTTEPTVYDIKPLKRTEKFIDITASDNVAIDFNFYVTTQIPMITAPIIHELQGKKWYENSVQDRLRTIVRNEARSRTSIDLRTNEVVIGEAEERICSTLRDYLKEEAIHVNIKKCVIGRVIPPDEVLAEAAQTAAEKQRVQTQTARQKAEHEREAAEVATAVADNAYRKGLGLSPAEYLRYMELVNQRMIITSEKASMDVTFLYGGNGVVPIHNIGK